MRLRQVRDATWTALSYDGGDCALVYAAAASCSLKLFPRDDRLGDACVSQLPAVMGDPTCVPFCLPLVELVRHREQFGEFAAWVLDHVPVVMDENHMRSHALVVALTKACGRQAVDTVTLLRFLARASLLSSWKWVCIDVSKLVVEAPYKPDAAHARVVQQLLLSVLGDCRFASAVLERMCVLVQLMYHGIRCGEGTSDSALAVLDMYEALSTHAYPPRVQQTAQLLGPFYQQTFREWSPMRRAWCAAAVTAVCAREKKMYAV